MSTNNDLSHGFSRPLKLAFIYDSHSRGLSEGFTPEELEALEFTSDETVEGIAQALRKLGTLEMIDGLKALCRRLGASPEKPDWDMVFNYCEGVELIPGRESQAPAILEAWGIPYTLSDSATMAWVVEKSRAKMICEHFKIPTSPFAVIPARRSWPADGLDSIAFINSSPHAEQLQEFPLFVKPSLTGSGNGVSQANKAANRDQLVQIIEELAKRHPNSSLLVERFLPGREFTVGIVGTGLDARAIGVQEFVFVKEGGPPPDAPYAVDENDPYFDQEVFGYLGKSKASYDPERPNPWQKILDMQDPVARDAARVALDAYRALGCRDAGRVDLRMDSRDITKAVPNFLELNAVPGLAPGWSDLVWLAEQNGISYDGLIAEIVSQALKRVGARV